jgi:hypothetical protein
LALSHPPTYSNPDMAYYDYPFNFLILKSYEKT